MSAGGGLQRWWKRERADWSAVREIMRGIQPWAWFRVVNRILTQPVLGHQEWVRTRTVIEELHSGPAPPGTQPNWQDVQTHYLVAAAIRHLPEGERVLADGELAMFAFHERPLRRLQQVGRWTGVLRVLTVFLGLLLVWLGLEWTGIAVMVAVVAASYAFDAAVWLDRYRAARRIWHDYTAAGGRLFSPEP